ncbi:MAG: ferrous iron transport protein A [Oscillospiraceae bacterium]|nr:ferrous iron transport protein A [Oscillospiraceae bacterium]
MTLDDLKIGQSGTIARVGGEGALRVRLLDMGLIPGTKVLLQKVAPMGDPIQIHLRGYELTIRREDAKKIDLREEKA